MAVRDLSSIVKVEKALEVRKQAGSIEFKLVAASLEEDREGRVAPFVSGHMNHRFEALLLILDVDELLHIRIGLIPFKK